MPKVTVMVYTTLRHLLSQAKMTVSGDTVADLLKELAAGKGPQIEKALFTAEGHVRQHFVIILNSQIQDNKKLDSAKVSDGDVLHIFPPVSGG